MIKNPYLLLLLGFALGWYVNEEGISRIIGHIQYGLSYVNEQFVMEPISEAIE